MWSSNHQLRVSDEYMEEWENFLKKSDSGCNPTFYQYAGHYIFKQLITMRHSITVHKEAALPPTLTYEEKNGLRYAAGYIPKMLRKRLKTSSHPLREDIILCIYDLLDDGDEEDDESQDWVHMVNRGGLTLVNNATFDFFLAMEKEVKRVLLLLSEGVDLSDHVKVSIAESEDVSFHHTSRCYG